MKALGLVEISGLVPAINALDGMLKTADVEFVTWEKKLGGRLVTIIVTGTVSSVTEAVNYVRDMRNIKLVAHAVIPRPHQELDKLIKMSSEKYKF
ncbi:ethanolamine utilization protein EutM [Vallitalea longa]|uniref:Ethanolamine utilization protein EutM n=1 Tax=Vallitalea longa TaxID=2936439 RepID=A0A9W5YA29_9FIRM|nr:BMC domain-containing protein [Vallitalea longa]GKX28164.1 ethanolamine utilization protein EutM [Vallitalea longa]